LLRRPELGLADVYAMAGLSAPDDGVAEQVQIEVKYEGYIKRQLELITRLKKLEDTAIPEDLDYSRLDSLSTEGREKLSRFRPLSLGQATRISGVSPSDISILMVYLKARSKRK
jgi:tRNA uridine 5-carboxymethylaminomethyl modification enzyme